MTIILPTLFGRQQKNLIDQLCRFPQSGKQMGRGLGTMDKKHNDLLNVWNIYCNRKRDRKKQKRQPKTLFKKMKKSTLSQQLKSRTK